MRFAPQKCKETLKIRQDPHHDDASHIIVMPFFTHACMCICCVFHRPNSYPKRCIRCDDTLHWHILTGFKPSICTIWNQIPPRVMSIWIPPTSLLPVALLITRISRGMRFQSEHINLESGYMEKLYLTLFRIHPTSESCYLHQNTHCTPNGWVNVMPHLGTPIPCINDWTHESNLPKTIRPMDEPRISLFKMLKWLLDCIKREQFHLNIYFILMNPGSDLLIIYLHPGTVWGELLNLRLWALRLAYDFVLYHP